MELTLSPQPHVTLPLGEEGSETLILFKLDAFDLSLVDTFAKGKIKLN